MHSKEAIGAFGFFLSNVSNQKPQTIKCANKIPNICTMPMLSIIPEYMATLRKKCKGDMKISPRYYQIQEEPCQ